MLKRLSQDESKNFVFYFILMAIGFFFIRPAFPGLDFDVYTHFIHSLLKDFDLNIANQRAAAGSFLFLTETGFDSDYHPYGMAFLYLPFALAGKLFGNIPALLAFGTFFYSFLSLRKIQLFSAPDGPSSRWLVFGLFFGTPLFFYTLFEPGNANIAAMFVSSLLACHVFQRKYDSLKYFFVWGALFATLCVVKKEAFFYALLLLLPWLESRALSPKKIFVFFAGAFPFALLFLFHNKNQFGGVFISQGGIDLSSFLPIELLFAPVHGHIFTSPLLLALFAWIALKDRQKSHLLVALIVLLKFFSESFTSNSGVNFGARAYLIDLPFLAPALAGMIFKGGLRAKLLVSFASLWCLGLAPIYLEGFRLMGLNAFIKDYFFTVDPWVGFAERIEPKSLILAPLGGLIALFFVKFKSLAPSGVFAGLFFILFFAAVANSGDSSVNPESLSGKGFAMGKGKELWHFREEISNFREREKYLLYRNRHKEALNVRSKRALYVQRAREQVQKGVLGENVVNAF